MQSYFREKIKRGLMYYTVAKKKKKRRTPYPIILTYMFINKHVKVYLKNYKKKSTGWIVISFKVLNLFIFLVWSRACRSTNHLLHFFCFAHCHFNWQKGKSHNLHASFLKKPPKTNKQSHTKNEKGKKALNSFRVFFSVQGWSIEHPSQKDSSLFCIYLQYLIFRK